MRSARSGCRRGNAPGRPCLGAGAAQKARLQGIQEGLIRLVQEFTRERVPLDWARTQMNLGLALQTLGWREAGTARLEEAVAAYRAALQEQTRERVPLDWAYTQHALAEALAALAARGKDALQTMEEAVACMRGALQAYQEAGESYWLPRVRRRTAELEAELAVV